MPWGPTRKKTETHAWCNKCKTMVANDGYNRGQSVCRECQNARMRDRYSKGRVCARCTVAPISNNAPGDYCRKCSFKNRSEATKPRREVNPARYVIITAQHDHPNADARGRIYEHIMVMSEKLGRPLRHGENVHHINGVRDDNRPENLELWVTTQPRGQRPEDLVAWAWEIIERYGSDQQAA